MNKLNNLLESIAKPLMPITPWLLRLGLGISFILKSQKKAMRLCKDALSLHYLNIWCN
mgnify:CR=1 FL=1